jgi:hypothetical protein
MCLLAIAASSVIAMVAALFARNLQNTLGRAEPKSAPANT